MIRRMAQSSRTYRLAGAFALDVSSVAALLTVLYSLPAGAQPLDLADCIKAGEPLLRMRELVSENGVLRGTIILKSGIRRLNDIKNGADGVVKPSSCANQNVRFFEGQDTRAPLAPPGFSPEAPSAPPSRFMDPIPGPTLRAQLGDIVQLTFLNHVDPLKFADTFTRGADPRDCDRDRGTDYPDKENDTFPNCFHGSSTANIHFHGTHTNPNTTGDNVFLNILPSLRHRTSRKDANDEGVPITPAKRVQAPFKEFFDACTRNLRRTVLSQWPTKWTDLPQTFRDQQERDIAIFDSTMDDDRRRLWKANEERIKARGWPQYIIGAFPYCFRLPKYEGVWPPPPGRLRMGQVPGLHWYHAHKHGSTALNVANGMTGAFVIEGDGYDGQLNRYYNEVPNWTRTQNVLVVNQLGGSPNLLVNRGAGAQALSVNGRFQPLMSMRPGEIQLWRIVNTASRSFAKFLAPTGGFQWRQLAQDGVQFKYENYKASHNKPFLLAPGNRADLLVKAPPAFAGRYEVMAEERVSKSAPAERTMPLLLVELAGTPPSREMEFIDDKEKAKFPIFPRFLEGIEEGELKIAKGQETAPKTLVFHSEGSRHTIDGQSFSDDKSGAIVSLNRVEEWKVENTSLSNIDHPFHIHINPFQVVEEFDPNELLINPETGAPILDPNTNQPAPKYVFDQPAREIEGVKQCSIATDNRDTWKPCDDKWKGRKNRIWWDVYPIPAGKKPAGGTTIPGYFKMRSRFVDYAGYYVLHCHILAHEDRGMMTVVEVRREGTREPPPKHH